MTDPKFGGDRSDAWWAAGVTALVVILVGYYVFWLASPTLKGNHILAILLGGVSGWTLGIVATPYNANEEIRLSGISKTVGAAISGYLLAKIDPLFTLLFGAGDNPQVDQSLLSQVCVGLVMMLDAVVLTYITRSYSWARQRSRR